MKYTYYPGCSLHGLALDYQMSVDAACKALAVELTEVDNWNCCGATATITENQKMAITLGALNLAKCPQGEENLVVSCNACYLRLTQVGEKFKKYPEIKDDVKGILREAGLNDSIEQIKVKHLLQILIEDIGLEAIEARVAKPLKDLRVVPYYGCQIVRPVGFDDPEQPTSLDNLLAALGADVVPFYRKTRCCGNAMINADEALALKMISEILDEAVTKGAEAIAVTCPICQLNLDAFQNRVNKKYGTNYNIPILYFTQLMGIAFGLEPLQLGLDKSIVSSKEIEKRYV